MRIREVKVRVQILKLELKGNKSVGNFQLKMRIHEKMARFPSLKTGSIRKMSEFG